MYSFLYSAAALDLTLGEILADLPRDAGAVVVLLMLGGFVFFTWYGSRRSTIQKYKPDYRSVAEPETEPGAAVVAAEAATPPPTMTAPARPARRRSRTDSERIDRVG